MVEQSLDLTNRTLLLNSNPINKWLDKYRVYRPGMTVPQRIGNFLVSNLAPFIRVESNSLMNRVVQRSPLAFLDPYTQKQLASGGAQFDIAMAKILYGTVSLGMAWTAADKAKNYLTGDVSDNEAKKKELLAGGELPRAVHETGHYDQSSNLAMSVFPWDQHNAVAQMVASAREAFDSPAGAADKATALKLAAVSVFSDLSKMTWINDMAPLVDAATAPHTQLGGKVAKFAGDEAKTFVPNILGQTERMTDNQRDTRTTDPTNVLGSMGNEMKSQIPGLAGTLPTRYNVYGEPQGTGATAMGVHTWFGRGNNLPEVSDPAEKELNRLAQLTPAAIVTGVQSTVKVDGANVKLTPAQQDEYQHYAGQGIVQAVRDQQQSGQWNQMSDKDKIAFVRSTQTEAKKQVRETLLQQDGWLNGDQLNSLRSQLDAKR